jgi:putative transposase
MTKKRRKLDDKFKARVALEAVRSDKTLSQLGSEFKVNPNQISKWKSQLINNASMVFSQNIGSNHCSEYEIKAPLYEEIGLLKMDLRWLEKKL